MKAVIVRKAGKADVLEVREITRPVPKPSEVLVEVVSATVMRGDTVLRKIPRIILLPIGILFGFRAQKIPGVEYAGRVVEVGENVTSFEVGDEVFGTTTGLSKGANAEYVCVPEKGRHNVLASKPEGLSFEDAACLTVGGMTAMDLFEKVDLEEGQKVLVYGASGSVGTFAVQIAAQRGCEVTGVCSTANVELVQSLGASRVVDYKKEDITQDGPVYDVVFDAVGKLKASGKKLVKKDGKRIGVRSPTKERLEHLEELGRMAAAGELQVVIDRRYSLDEIVEGHLYVESGRKKGNVPVTVRED